MSEKAIINARSRLNVTNAALCEAPNDENICPELTELEGVYVNNTSDDCDVFATCQLVRH